MALPRNELYRLRKRQGWTQTQIGDKLSMGGTTYHRKESGAGEFDLSEAVELADILHLEGADEVYRLLMQWRTL